MLVVDVNFIRVINGCAGGGSVDCRLDWCEAPASEPRADLRLNEGWACSGADELGARTLTSSKRVRELREVDKTWLSGSVGRDTLVAIRRFRCAMMLDGAARGGVIGSSVSVLACICSSMYIVTCTYRYRLGVVM